MLRFSSFFLQNFFSLLFSYFLFSLRIYLPIYFYFIYIFAAAAPFLQQKREMNSILVIYLQVKAKKKSFLCTCEIFLIEWLVCRYDYLQVNRLSYTDSLYFFLTPNTNEEHSGYDTHLCLMMIELTFELNLLRKKFYLINFSVNIL